MGGCGSVQNILDICTLLRLCSYRLPRQLKSVKAAAKYQDSWRLRIELQADKKDCQDIRKRVPTQFQTFKTTAENCRLSRRLQTFADHLRNNFPVYSAR